LPIPGRKAEPTQGRPKTLAQPVIKRTATTKSTDDDELEIRSMGETTASRSTSASSSSSMDSLGPLAGLRCEQLRRTRTFHQDYEATDVVLGTGLSGSVNKAVCRKTGQAVAVKIFDVSSMQPKPWAQLKSEIEIQSGLDHPGVARIEAVYKTETKVQLVMELLEGGEMFDRIVDESAQGPLSERKAAQALTQLLLTIDYLHAQGVVHRDIKPENLIFERKGDEAFKLIDFGFACQLAPGAKFTERCGTMQYVAPEVVQVPSSYDEKVDLWSTGCVAYVMLTGRNPYRGPQREVLRKTLLGAVDYSPAFWDCSPAARDFVQLLLNPDPTRRPSAAEALRHPWLKQVLLFEDSRASSRRSSATSSSAAAGVIAEAGFIAEAGAAIPSLEQHVVAGNPQSMQQLQDRCIERPRARVMGLLLPSLRDLAACICR